MNTKNILKEKMNKEKWSDIKADELMQILKFLNSKVRKFSTFEITQLPNKESWSFMSGGILGKDSLTINLTIERKTKNE